MKDHETRVLGRILAVEELDAVSGARTLPAIDMTVPPDGLRSGETGLMEDSGTLADSGTASDTTPHLQDTKPVLDTLQQP